ncbi:hypothetical protein LRAMOSA03631 [Lichtheimia ramosa]|uniref:BHLH domain-containing protein n=1 Tax=Lichtheimia ramosa TaxID=688394 RepID=A0A077WWH0_9FUNG|nr:hypothetical protein LRAMOSA03631 [Lichtheimia ramosa]
MSEIVLSNTSNQYLADYSAGSMMSNFNANMDSPSATSSSSPPPVTFDGTQQHQQPPYTYQDYAFQQMYQAMPMAYPTMSSRIGYYGDKQQQQQQHPGSPDSVSSTSSPQTPPTAAGTNHEHSAQLVLTTQALDQQQNNATAAAAAAAVAAATPHPQLITPLVPSSTFTNSTTERVKETIARANAVPMEFYHTEFLEYSKETYERKMDAKRNKRKRSSPSSDDNAAKKKKANTDTEKDDLDDDQPQLDDDEINKEAEERGMTTAELRRQIHIQSEQKRRAQIKDGFDELRKHLPGCTNKKMSKAALLTRTVQQIQHLKNMQTELLSEVERLVQENETLKKFQHGVLQRQAMEKMYTF